MSFEWNAKHYLSKLSLVKKTQHVVPPTPLSTATCKATGTNTNHQSNRTNRQRQRQHQQWSSSWSTRKLLLIATLCNTLLLFITAVGTVHAAKHDSDASLTTNATISNGQVVSQCERNCSQQMNLDDDLDIACNATCKIEQCQVGCRMWYNRPVSCFDKCQNSSLVENWVIYCAIGCNHAHTIYVEHIKSVIELPEAPKLVAGSVTNDSVTIEWQLQKELLQLSYRVQWKYANVPSTWTYAPGGSITTDRLRMTGLYAYTAYLFRVEWELIPWMRISTFSRASEPITTLPYGVPSTPCVITSCLAISASQISVTWDEPQFANGPIIAYTLYLTENGTGHRTVKDIKMDSDHYFDNGPMNFVFNGLKPETEYMVAIVTFNNFGEGPISKRTISTLSIEASSQNQVQLLSERYSLGNSPTESYRLFVASTKEVGRRHPEMLLDEEIVYHLTDYTENAEITGMTIHVSRKYLFVADSSGTVRRVLLKEDSINQVLRIINGSNMPSHLSMDWLNDKLYFVEDSRITRSSLDGDSLETVVTGLRKRPLDMKVDPYNGFLFWLLADESERSTLHRVDLADISAGHKVSVANSQIICQAKGISAFAVNYFDYRIYFPVSSSKSVYTVTIDGKDPESIRDNSNDREVFAGVENLIIYDRKLYFIKGNNISWEEFHEEEQTYYHNVYNTEAQLVSLVVMDYQSQPYPVPLNPVERVQAIFLDTSAKISWEKPKLYGGAGRGAWQNWKYEVSIEEEDTRVVHQAQVNNTTNCVADELKPDTVYLIKVRALSIAGKGAWSDVFKGRTMPVLKSGPGNLYIAVSTKEGMLKTDIGGKFLHQMVTRSELNGLVINDIAWYKDVILLNTDTALLAYNTTSQGTPVRLGNMTRVASIEVEWLAGKVYWSNPLERMICRSNLDGSQLEILPILTYANKLVIDSYNGFLYWSTQYNIEYARLNGMKRTRREVFRANEIKSITVNQADSSLYFVSVTGGVTSLFKTPLANKEVLYTSANSPQPVKIAKLADHNLIGPISIFAGRLFWLNIERNQIQISDAQAQTFAAINELEGVYAFKIIDQTTLKHWNNSLSVIPDSVNATLVKISGTWENFTLHWKPVSNVNYGQVFYDLVLEDQHNQRTNLILTETQFNYPNELKPMKAYTKIRVAIRAFTYWASAKQIVLTMHTPSSIPSKPRDIRVFIFVNQTLSTASNSAANNIVAEARWNPPQDTNGVILSYTISLWSVAYDNKVASISNQVIPNQLSYRFEGLQPNATYYFEVRATTEAGEGPPSEVYQFKTFQDISPSRLLLAESTAILLSDMDLRQNKVIGKSLDALMMDYHYSDNLIYWIEKGNFLKRTSLSNGTNFELVAQLHERATGLSLDWIGRRLYVSSVDRHRNQSTIWQYDLADSEAELQQVLELPHKEIHCFRVNPFTSELIFTESNINQAVSLVKLKSCQLTKYGRKCDSVRDFFPNDRTKLKQKSCNCTYSTTVGKQFTINFATKQVNDKPEAMIVYFDQEGLNFASADPSGCYCHRLTGQVGKQPTTMTTDTNLYWMNSTVGKIYRFNLEDTLYFGTPSRTIERFEYEDLRINSLLSYNVRNQPYPDYSCLIPHNLQIGLQMMDNTAYSITVKVQVNDSMPNSSTNTDSLVTECDGLSLASLRYRVRYRKHYHNVQIDCRRANVPQCQTFETFNSTFTVSELEPFTNYTFSVEIDNHYLAIMPHFDGSGGGVDNGAITFTSNSIQRGGGGLMFVPTDEYRFLFNGNFVFSTAESRPGPPRNVRAIVETPEKILILWERPEKVNSNHINYEIRWYSVESSRKSMLHSNNHTRHGSYYMYLENIKPGKEYNVSVRAYAVDNHQYMDSKPLLVQAYDEPSTVRVLRTSARAIILEWQSQAAPVSLHQLFMQTEDPDDSWTGFVPETTRPFTTYRFPVHNLAPNKRYRFYLKLTYNATGSDYNWPREPLLVSTTADVPDTPLLHEIASITDEKDNPTRIYKVNWDPVNSNSHSPVYYALYEKVFDHEREEEDDDEEEEVESETKSMYLSTNHTLLSVSVSASKTVLEENSWNLVYNGTDNYWIISGLESGRKHVFRVAAFNVIGRSNYSVSSMPFYLPFQAEYDQNKGNENVLLIVIVLCAVLVVLLTGFVFISLRKYNKNKTLEKERTDRSDFPIELVPWTETPGFPHLPNRLYQYVNSWLFSPQESLDMKDIKTIDSNQITKGKLIGQGNFGQVFEGFLYKCEAKVALKALKPDASVNDQINFLKEAKFMAKLKHPNILQQLGVCFNSDQVMIVMELMEGGDLLGYLRSNRPNRSLSMEDLLSICIDVAKGCEYLETVQFVHRDLAARNCLVSSVDRSKRVVKISDFGLTRGIYRHDYYRQDSNKELPVRWMAPECIVDGVFTAQSDVWSFGTVMYEVMTFGEHLYQGKSNQEVVDYVKQGGTLEQPPGCPFAIYSLMKRCWSYKKDQRPNFKSLLEYLESYRRVYHSACKQQYECTGKRNSQMTTVHNQNYGSEEMCRAAGAQQISPSLPLYNNMVAPPLPKHSPDYVYASRLSSITMVLDQIDLSSPSSSPLLSTAYVNVNGRPVPICEATDDDDERFCMIDAEGYQIPIRGQLAAIRTNTSA